MRYLVPFFIILFSATGALAGDTNWTGRLVTQTADATVPTCSTASGDGDICVGDAIESVGQAVVGGALTVTGAQTFTGATTLSGDVTIAQGDLTGYLTAWSDKTADTNIAVTDCGANLSSNDDNRVFNLPAVAAANAGCVITVTNTAADGGALMSVSPDANDGIFGGCSGLSTLDPNYANFNQFTGTDDKDAQNTKSTHDRGDFIRVVSDGSVGWYVIGCSGIWAEQG